MKKMATIILYLVCLCVVFSTNLLITNADLKGRCEDPSSFSKSFCRGFFSKVSLSCLPDGVSDDQRALIFVKWVNNHPEKLNEPAGRGAKTSLIEAFPSCLRFPLPSKHGLDN
jgi:hypothetical protein